MPIHAAKRWVRRSAVAVLGCSITLLGLVLWVSPLPLGIVFIPTGLLILATEFAWAQRLLHHAKTKTGPVGRVLATAETAAKHRFSHRGRQPTNPQPMD
ncbi:MAG: PGPGW domain-containing protein [Planctomycetota bacterium]